MVLVLFLIALSFKASWQHEGTEKNLNEILDQLIEETIDDTFSNEKLNNSRIIYLRPNITSRRVQEQSLNTIHSSEYQDLEDLINHMGHSKHISGHLKQNSDEESVLQQITVEIEQSPVFDDNHGGDAYQELQIINNGFSKSGRPLFEKVIESSIENLVSKPDNNINRNYPEVYIDKVTYDDNKNQEEVDSISLNSVNTNHDTHINNLRDVHKEIAAKALDSLMKLLIKDVATKKSLEGSNEYSEQDDIDAVLRSTHIHNAYHNHVINNVPYGYRGLSSQEKMLVAKLPEGYRDMHGMVNRPINAYLDPNLQLNRWGGNVGANSLMSILRAHQLNHARFNSRPHIIPRFIYQPLHHHHRYI